MFHAVAADGLAMQGARALVAMALTLLSQNIPFSAPDKGLLIDSWDMEL